MNIKWHTLSSNINMAISKKNKMLQDKFKMMKLCKSDFIFYGQFKLLCQAMVQ